MTQLEVTQLVMPQLVVTLATYPPRKPGPTRWTVHALDTPALLAAGEALGGGRGGGQGNGRRLPGWPRRSLASEAEDKPRCWGASARLGQPVMHRGQPGNTQGFL